MLREPTNFKSCYDLAHRLIPKPQASPRSIRSYEVFMARASTAVFLAALSQALHYPQSRCSCFSVLYFSVLTLWESLMPLSAPEYQLNDE